MLLAWPVDEQHILAQWIRIAVDGETPLARNHVRDLVNALDMGLTEVVGLRRQIACLGQKIGAKFQGDFEMDVVEMKFDFSESRNGFHVSPSFPQRSSEK